MPSADEPQPRRFHGTTFALQDVRLDGVQFVQCQFKAGCRLIFAGESLPTFTQCEIAEDVEFVLAGAAKLTFQFLSALYYRSGKGGSDTVDALFQQLRNGRFE